MAKKSCKQGYYYCYASKKCKKIPMGYVVGMGGWLRKEKEEEKSSEETEGKKTNGNGNGSNGNGNGNGGSNGGSNGGGVSEAWSAKYKKSIDCDNPKGFSQRAHCRGRKMNEAKGGDHEVAMAQSQLKKSAENIAKLRKALGKKEKDIPAWMQAKITDTAHDTDAAAGYVDKMDEEVIAEKRDGKSAKDKGYSLRDWFKGGGWVQAGGKYDGKPCAKQPGQKTKPYCRDADDRAAMSKEERNKRARKKRKEDPNPNRKGKAKNVTQESYSNWRQDLQEKPGDGYLGPTMNVGGKEYGVPNPIRIAKDVVDNTNRANQRKVDQVNKTLGRGSASISPYTLFNKQTSTASQNLFGMQKQSYEPEGDTVSEGDYRYGSYSTGRQKMLDGSLKTPADIDAYIKSKKSGKKPPVQTDKAHYEPEGELVDEGKKDACYHKVKSRYSVWPSAYASGALVKCRKVGAKNWGNKTKKEGYEYSNWKDDFVGTEYESVDIIKPEPLQPTEGIGSQMLDEAPMVEPSTSAAVPAKRPSMMQQVQSLRAMRMRSMQRQGLPLEAEKIRSKLSTSEVNASNERARELDKIRRQSRDATIASSRTQQPTPPARGPIARTPMQQRTAPVTKTQPTSNTSTITPPAVNQQQRDAAAKLDDATLKRYNMDPKVVRPQPEPKVRPAATGGQDDVGTMDDNTRPGVVPLEVKPAQNQSSSQQRVQQVASTTEKSFNDKLFGSMGYTKNPLGNSYLSPQQIRRIERDIRMNKNYNAGGLRQFYNPDTKKLELPEEVQLDEKCWKGYEKKGMKTMFGKRYPNCVKKKKTRKEEVEHIDEKINPLLKGILKKTPKGEDPKKGGVPYKITGRMTTADEYSNWKAELAIQEDWQKANRRDKTDGMSQKAVDAYKRENPGSKLKTAVTGKVKKGSKDAKRRKSFCSRSNGQRKMHNIDCSKTPDKKICKARRRWKC